MAYALKLGGAAALFLIAAVVAVLLFNGVWFKVGFGAAFAILCGSPAVHRLARGQEGEGGARRPGRPSERLAEASAPEPRLSLHANRLKGIPTSE